MEFHETPWIIHATPWNSMEHYGTLWIVHGVPWNSMDTPWNSMELHGTPWTLHGTPWNFMEPHGHSMDTPWNFHGVPWNSMELHGIPLNWNSMEVFHTRIETASYLTIWLFRSSFFSYISIFFNFLHQCLLLYVLKVLFLCFPQGNWLC